LAQPIRLGLDPCGLGPKKSTGIKRLQLKKPIGPKSSQKPGGSRPIHELPF